MMVNPETKKLLTQAAEGFSKRFGRAPKWLSRAPGRLEILGNHTDYNEGTVLSVAVDRAMHIALAPNPNAESGMLCRLYDLRSDSARSFRLDELDRKERGDWANYIKGLVCEFNERGFIIPAFDAVLLGTVPLSAGMSSSAALEMAMAKIFNELADAKLEWLELAKIGQGCENNYVGAKTGLMDQLSSLRGKAGQLIHSDFRSFEVYNVPVPKGCIFVVANSMVKHNLTNEYNERRSACNDAAATLGVSALRDVSLEALEAARPRLKEESYLRAKHVVGEITRVAAGSDALMQGDIRRFGELMSESHLSSRQNFDNSCPEIDLLCEIGSTLPGHLGARISGGGFGGICVHLVEESAAVAYQETLANAYEAKTGVHPQVMLCQAADGAAVFPL